MNLMRGKRFLFDSVVRNRRLDSYREILETAKENGYTVCSLEDFYFLPDRRACRHFILRHDVDYTGIATRKMFEAEKAAGVKSTYYFRMTTIDRELIHEMQDAGFDVGFHFETVANYIRQHQCTEKGQIDLKAASALFAEEIGQFSEAAGIRPRSVCSHGAPENARLSISNNALTEQVDLSRYGIAFEAYDKELYEKDVDCHIMDCAVTNNYGFAYRDTPLSAFSEGRGNIVFLSHPNHWYMTQQEQLRSLAKILAGKAVYSTDRQFVRIADQELQQDPMIKLFPAFKDYLWGGTKLRNLYGKQCDYDSIAESWELSAHPAGCSIVASGRYKGLSFSKYLETAGWQVLGSKCSELQVFPLLIKFIDARQDLSIQVHPDDDYALEHENEYGKNEMWYVIETEPGAGLYIGFNRDVSRGEVERRITDHTIREIMNFIPTRPGELFYIPAGTAHAIGAGNMICEIQQSSNCSYRLYDYDRRDRFGKPRELHLQKALDVLNYRKYEPAEEPEDGIRCKDFEVSILNIEGEREIRLTDDSFYSLTCIKGSGILHLETEMPVLPGETVFISATNHPMTVTGNLSVILARV